MRKHELHAVKRLGLRHSIEVEHRDAACSALQGYLVPQAPIECLQGFRRALGQVHVSQALGNGHLTRIDHSRHALAERCDQPHDKIDTLSAR